MNAVGVDLNTASAPLLAHVSGLGPSLAEAIVAHRDEKGAFRSRKELLAVPRLGPRAFEQCAGLPAHPRRRRAARRLGGASRGLRRRPPDRRRLRPRPARADGRRGAAEGASTRRTSSTSASACRPCGHPRRARQARPRPAARPSSPRASPTASTTISRPEARDAARGHGDQRRGLRRLRRHRRAPGRARPRLASSPTASSRTRTRWSRPATW